MAKKKSVPKARKRKTVRRLKYTTLEIDEDMGSLKIYDSDNDYPMVHLVSREVRALLELLREWEEVFK